MRKQYFTIPRRVENLNRPIGNHIIIQSNDSLANEILLKFFVLLSLSKILEFLFQFLGVLL